MRRADVFDGFAWGMMATGAALIAGFIFAPDQMLPTRMTCVMTTPEGCAVWVDKTKLASSREGKADQ